MVARLGVARRSANGLVEAAGRLEQLPILAGVLADGGMSFDQVRAACQLASPETDGDIAEEAPACTVAHLEGRVRLARRVTEEDDAERQRQESVWWRWDKERGWLDIRGGWGGADGAMVVAALEREANQAQRAPISRLYEPFDARCAVALVALASQRLASDADPDRATVV